MWNKYLHMDTPAYVRMCGIYIDYFSVTVLFEIHNQLLSLLNCAARKWAVGTVCSIVRVCGCCVLCAGGVGVCECVWGW